jgi:outer membrane receptor protein involved in Fe transport
MQRNSSRTLVALIACLCSYAPVVRAHEPSLTPPAVIEISPVQRPAQAGDPRSVRVVLTLKLDAAGQLTSADLADIAPAGPDDASFIEAARTYVQTVRFAPARSGEAAVASSVRFEVQFPALPDRGADAGVGASPAEPTPGAQPLPLDASVAPADAASTASSAASSHGEVAPADAASLAISAPAARGELAHAHKHKHEIVHSHLHGAHEAHAVEEYSASALIARPERSASAYTLSRKDLPRGAHVVAGDLARAVPGMFVVQHAGGGKANQYFLRGFDADHGTDVALSVDGIPVNMVSHGHGQGYADLNWIIPELVETVVVRKGTYDARDGDFATAGAIDFQTGTELQNRVTVEGGMFHSYRALALVGTRHDDLKLSAAAELLGTDGPFERAEDLQRINLFARAATELGQGELALTMTGYLSGWNASGQIPLRAVRAGTLDRFGSLDPYEGGSSSRHNLSLRYRSAPTESKRWEALAYATLYRFSLYSDFTFFRDDSARGDMIHQRDRRTLGGAKLRYERDDSLGSLQLTTRFGFELRHDAIDNGLDRAPGREWADSLVDARIDQTSAGAYLEQEVEWTRWLRTTAGVRADTFSFSVADALEDRATLSTRSSGEKLATRVSPKASVTLTPIAWLSLYGNYGLGFHSNDARGVLAGVTPLTRADGYEVGLSIKLLERVRARVALFRIDLDSELVWVGDEGTTEASGATRRQGFETDVHVDVLPWLFADASLVLTQAEYVDAPAAEARVALAPRRLLTGKLTAIHPSGPFGRLSVMNLGARPATEDGSLTAEGFTRVDLSVGYRHPRFELAVSLENLLDTSWRESQFANSSRLRGEDGPEACGQGSRAVSEGGAFVGCEDMHFTPGTPFALRASASLLF